MDAIEPQRGPAAAGILIGVTRIGTPSTDVGAQELGERDLGERILGERILGERMTALHAVIERLRRDCPWDRAQTHASLAPYTLDEAAELAEALQAADRALAGDDADHDAATAVEDLVGELGDVLLQVLMNTAIGEQAGTFTLVEVLETVEAKMLRRHPHVFERAPDSPEPSDGELSKQWESIKAAERKARSERIAARAARTG
ncbi:MazG nucleotide pyrophosphohydrolase domain-containing protein [Candidatus Poriferisodalis sp.]|uniref:MazG nucleotide pyrophosphohydrolase domain-containing protein n=1 Tax=Candidatus Poriferisodalis sp. TaxID=3101277 RepID=UPI003B01BCCA